MLIFIASLLIVFVVMPYVASKLHKVMKGIVYYSTCTVLIIFVGYGLYFMNHFIDPIGMR